MSVDDLASHLNLNKFKTGYGEDYKGGRGTYTLVQAAYNWVHGELGLTEEAGVIAEAFVKPDGSYAWEVRRDAR